MWGTQNKAHCETHKWNLGCTSGGRKSSHPFAHQYWNLGASPGTLVVKNPPASAGDIKRCGFNPWVGKIPWRGAWQPTPVFLPGESREQRSLAGYGPRVRKSRTRLSQLSTHTHTHRNPGWRQCRWRSVQMHLIKTIRPSFAWLCQS